MTRYFQPMFFVLVVAVTETSAEDRATPDPVMDVEIDDLTLKIDRTSPFDRKEMPKIIRNLQGRRVRLRGYMSPTFRASGVTEFVFNGETKQRGVGFNADAPLHFVIIVTLRAGTSTSFTIDPVLIEGRFIIEPLSVNGTIQAVYKVDDATVTKTNARSGFHPSMGFGC